MAYFTKESLEILKQRVDIVDVISSHVDLKRSGVSHKGLCPFHDEKSPSFHVTKGQGFYHCFGCGAHGDAITFMMQHARLAFSDAVEALAQRYQVVLEKKEYDGSDKEKVDRQALKFALEKASGLYHTYLLHTPEGHEACRYLFSRGIDLPFIQKFQIGLAPQNKDIIYKVMKRLGIEEKTLLDAGIFTQNSNGSIRDPYSHRITFPIKDAAGSVIGFSARKFKEETYGGKYVNTSETALFKKSKILFGLDQSRRRIAKERRAILVEGQLDALRLLHHGLDITVATQGTAFGESHLKELSALGIQEALLAFDSDKAGREAAFKVGNLFAKAGIGVKIIKMPDGADPDSLVLSQGIDAFLKLLTNPQDYISFLVEHLSLQYDVNSPTGKNALVHQATTQIHAWGEPIVVHESMRRLAQLLQLPEEMVGSSLPAPAHVYIKKNALAGALDIDPDKVIESDLLRWLILTGPLKPHFITIAFKNIYSFHFADATCRHIFDTFKNTITDCGNCDLLSLASSLEDPHAHHVIHELVLRKVNLEKADELFRNTVQKLLEREWMRKREAIRLKIQSGSCSEDEVINLLKEFDHLKKAPPQILEHEECHGDAPHTII